MNIYKFLDWLLSGKINQISTDSQDEMAQKIISFGFVVVDKEIYNRARPTKKIVYTQICFLDPVLKQNFYFTTSIFYSLIAELNKNKTTEYCLRLDLTTELETDLAHKKKTIASEIAWLQTIELPKNQYFNSVETFSDGSVNHNNSNLNTEFEQFFDESLCLKTDEDLFSNMAIKELKKELNNFLELNLKKLDPH